MLEKGITRKYFVLSIVIGSNAWWMKIRIHEDRELVTYLAVLNNRLVRVQTFSPRIGQRRLLVEVTVHKNSTAKIKIIFRGNRSRHVCNTQLCTMYLPIEIAVARNGHEDQRSSALFLQNLIRFAKQLISFSMQ